jgi:uncharacterized protein
MQFYDHTVPQMKHALANLDRWLAKAAAHERGDDLLTMRLAPDQFTLVRQIQTACDNAKMMSGRLAGREWPSHPDTETTFAQLRERITSVTSYLDTLTADDFAGASDRNVRLPWMQPDQFMTAADYLIQFALPNFYFHLVTAYSILRHEGVQLGKIDFLGPIAIKT